jgi:hypothetical protein
MSITTFIFAHIHVTWFVYYHGCQMKNLKNRIFLFEIGKKAEIHIRSKKYFIIKTSKSSINVELSPTYYSTCF